MRKLSSGRDGWSRGEKLALIGIIATIAVAVPPIYYAHFQYVTSGQPISVNAPSSTSDADPVAHRQDEHGRQLEPADAQKPVVPASATAVPLQMGPGQECFPEFPDQAVNSNLTLSPYMYWTFCFANRETMMRTRWHRTLGYLIELPDGRTFPMKPNGYRRVDLKRGSLDLWLSHNNRESGPEMTIQFSYTPNL